MALLAAAVVIVGVLVLLDLLLTLALIRRVRTHTELLNQQSAGAPPADLLPAVGTPIVVPEKAVTTAGETIGAVTFPEGALVGFFSTSCSACHEQLPRYLEQADRIGAGQVLSVVHSDPLAPVDAGQGFERLAEVGRVVHEGPDGVLGRAFGIRAYPSVVLVDHGWRVAQSSTTADDLQPGLR